MISDLDICLRSFHKNFHFGKKSHLLKGLHESGLLASILRLCSWKTQNGLHLIRADFQEWFWILLSIFSCSTSQLWSTDRALLLNDPVRAGDASLSYHLSILPREVLASAAWEAGSDADTTVVIKEVNTFEIPEALRSPVSRALFYFPFPTTYSSNYTPSLGSLFPWQALPLTSSQLDQSPNLSMNLRCVWL